MPGDPMAGEDPGSRRGPKTGLSLKCCLTEAWPQNLSINLCLPLLGSGSPTMPESFHRSLADSPKQQPEDFRAAFTDLRPHCDTATITALCKGNLGGGISENKGLEAAG